LKIRFYVNSIPILGNINIPGIQRIVLKTTPLYQYSRSIKIGTIQIRKITIFIKIDFKIPQ